MRKKPTTTISFRATEQLRKKLEAFCVSNEQCNSGVIRQAIVTYLQRKSVPDNKEPFESNLALSNF